MKRWLLCIVLLAGLMLLTPPAYAATQEHIQFKLRIVPLDCTIDIIDYGYGPIQVITCPPDPDPPPPPEPPPTPEPEPPLVPAPLPQAPPALNKILRSDELLDKLYSGNLLGGAGFMLRIDRGAKTTNQPTQGGAALLATGVLFSAAALLSVLQGVDLLRGGPGLIPVIAHRWRRRKHQREDFTDEP